jgi:sugar/nucleoside kinase (ribokinase family)
MERGDLRDAVVVAGIQDGTTVWFVSELRLGLHGRTRRVLAPRGVKLVQRVQVEHRWRYLLLAVAQLRGEHHRAWIERMRQEYLRPVLEQWKFACVVWDGVPSHKGKQIAALETQRIALPAYSPELNPAERVFEEIRARVEGVGYESLDAKQAEVETYLKELQDDPERVKQLCGWAWLDEALTRLPPPAAASSYVPVSHPVSITPALSASCAEAVEHAIQLASGAGLLVCVDPNIRLQLWSDIDTCRKTVGRLLAHANIALLGHEDAEVLFPGLAEDEILDAVHSLGPSMAVLKRGERGARAATSEERIEVEACAVRAIDTVGAGDGFDAGFVAGWLRGFSLERSLRLGAQVGAAAVAVSGDWEGYPTAAQLDLEMRA